MQSRYYNHITVHTDQVAITKTSDHSSKLTDEILWYLDLPKQLKPYTPSVKSYSLGKPCPWISLDLIPGGTMGDALTNDIWTKREWMSAMTSMWKVLKHFSQFKGTLSKACTYDMYIHKTRQRLSAFLHQNEWARQIHKQGYFRINGATFESPTILIQKQYDALLTLMEDPEITILHGDFCLSNLFFNTSTSEIKVIDPRGRFGGRGIYGDHRYDWAKLRHSLSGYEHLVRGHFAIKLDPYAIDLQIDMKPEHTWMRRLLDSWLGTRRLKSILLIEALLFLSMLPLHKDNTTRQLALFAKGTELLERALSERGEPA